MGEEGKGKKSTPLSNIWTKMTPEERDAFIAKRTEKIRAAKKRETEERLAKEENDRLRKEAQALRAGGKKEEILIQKIRLELTRMSENTTYLPQWEMLNAGIALSKEGRDLEALREEFFPHIGQEVWLKFKKAMFATQISSPEDVGNDLLVARDLAVADIRKQIEKMKEQQKTRPLLFHTQIIKAYNDIQQIHSDTAKRLVDIGAVGNKRSGGISVQIVNYIPRPDRPLAHDKKTSTYISTAPREIAAESEVIVDVPVSKVKVDA